MRRANFIYFAILLFFVSNVLAQNPQFSRPVSYSVGNYAYAICSGDFNADGFIDLAVTNALSDNFTILINDGYGSFIFSADYAAGNEPISICCADFDNDQDVDLAIANYFSSVSVHFNNGNGTFQSAVNYPYATGLRSICASDFDNDADQDLVVANENQDNISILINNGAGVFTNGGYYPTGIGPRSIAISDFDDDGFPDLAVANGFQYSNTISVLVNNGNCTFMPRIDYISGDMPWTVFASDFDGDEDEDIVAGTIWSHSVSILRNDGNGVFGIPEEYLCPSVPLEVYAADLDNDFDKDIAISQGSGNAIFILQNNGNGLFSSVAAFDAGGCALSLEICDYDSDSDLDIAVTNCNSNTVSILTNLTYGLGVFNLLFPFNESIVNQIPFELAWSASQCGDSTYLVYYNLYWDDSAVFDSPDSLFNLIDTITFFDAEISRSKEYYWRVKAHTSFPSSRYSQEMWHYYLNGCPSLPRIIAPLNGVNGDSTTVFVWVICVDPDSFDAVSYTIQIDDDSTFASPEIDHSDLRSGEFIVDDAFVIRLGELEGFTNLQVDTRYFWRVRADDNYGLSSDWTDGRNWFIFMAQNHAPSAPDSGFTPSGGEEIISLTPTIAWFAASDPDSDDHPGTLSYSIELDTDTTFTGFVYRDTTGQGENLITISDPLLDNAHYFYRLKTLDDGGLSSGWSAIQNFWTNHYNFPPEPFPLYAPGNGQKQVVYYTHFSWGNTVDHDPNSSFTFTVQHSPDSLFRYDIGTLSGLPDTATSIATDSLTLSGLIYWRVLAIDDDSLSRTGGLPEGPRSLLIIPPGDANTNGVTNGIDATFMVAYLKGQGAAPDPIQAGDANGNCTTNGIDVVYLVAYLKGIGAPPVRPDCDIVIAGRPKPLKGGR